jgi:catechol 2,3-dioxygenase-like lactoylglutathione lyase family enzyme
VKLNHLDLLVPDVVATQSFLVRHFELTLLSKATSPAIAILGDGHGFVLVLQRRARDTDVYPDGFHIGFLVDDEATVHQQHARLTAAGVDVSPVETNGRGTMFYCHAPGDLTIEVSKRRG